MKFERLIVVVALLSPGCSKRNASFLEATAESAEGSTSMGVAGTTTGGGGPGTSTPTDPPEPTTPKPPESTTSGPDSSGPRPTESDAGETISSGLYESSGTGDTDPCGPPSGGCTPVLQDCGDGYRCRPYDSDGDNVLDQFGCFPRIRSGGSPICDQACGRLSGLDSCPTELLCDPITNTGACVQPCHAEIGCEIGSCNTDGIPGMNYGVCRAECDPFEKDCPDDGLCVLGSEGPNCEIAAGDLEVGAVCGASNVCEPGLVCLNADPESGCDGSSCCTEICSLSSGDCEPGFACVPAYPDEPTSNTEIGVCIEDI